MSGYTEILFEEMAGEGGKLGIMTLNRPQVLNSLNHTMIHAMHAKLQQWLHAPDIKAVILRAAEGRAFCAGGDLRLTYERAVAGDAAAMDFFRDEYDLNRFIYHYPKPYIALLDGITMGGGVGISIHGSHRVVTERVMFAMPETGIGFFPDVGGTYFLPRLTGRSGYYLGLTGARIGADDCVAVGIAQHKVASASMTELIHAIARQPFSKDAKSSVTDVIQRFSMSQLQSPLASACQIINDCFSGEMMETIVASLTSSSDVFAQKALEMIGKKSPTSLKVTLKAMIEGEQMDFDNCMDQEYCLSTRFLQGHDFKEGIRAVIIDKDQAPVWQPADLQGVSIDTVNQYFSPIVQDAIH